MEIAVSCLTLIALGLIAAIVALVRGHAEERAQVAIERRELLTRIQRPEYVPVTQDEIQLPEQEPDEWDLVGTINRDPVEEPAG